jgi:hypothetical protein
MPRYFTLDQALDILPEASRRLRAAVEARQGLADVEEEISAFTRKVQVMGGVRLDPPHMAELGQRRQNSAEKLKDAMDRLDELGIQVKDLDVGLIDFPTLYRGQEVLLCYRMGESTIEYWHGLEEGFRGRKRIDQDFLSNHTGGIEH